MTLSELRTTQKQSILSIAAKRGARNVRVFGSVARGQSDDSSDVDFLVDLEPTRTLFDLSGLAADLEICSRGTSTWSRRRDFGLASVTESSRRQFRFEG
jgi:predicted nucleotidyltransferase